MGQLVPLRTGARKDTTGVLDNRGAADTVWARTTDGAGIFTYMTPPSPGRGNAGMM